MKSIYRVVMVYNGNIEWTNGGFHSTKDKALDALQQIVNEKIKFLGYKSELYQLHPWDSFPIREGETSIWRTVHMVVNVIDTMHQKKMTYGIITYRLD